MDRTKFSYGVQFQQKLLKILIDDGDFMESIIDLLKPSYFSFTVHQQLFKILNNYFKKYKMSANIDIILNEIKKLEDRIIQLSILEKIQQIYNLQIQYKQIVYIKQNALQFIKNRQLDHALQYSNSLLNSGKQIDYQKIRDVMNRALQIQTEQDEGSDLAQSLQHRYSLACRKPVKTGWIPIDNLMNGGLGSGQLGVIMAASGIGKTWGLVHIGASAIKQGFKVAHITLQLSRDYTNRRYDSKFTGIDFNELENYKERIKQVISQYNGMLRTKSFPRAITNTMQIQRYINKLMKQFGPNLIVIDYADLLRPTIFNTNWSLYEIQGQIYTQLGGIGQKYKVPIWTATQTNRQGHSSQYSDLDDMAQSYKKAQIADFVMSFSRKLQDSANNTARCFIAKNRFGKDKILMPVKVNLNNGDIDIIDSRSVIGKDIMKQMQDKNKQFKKLLKNKIGKL